MPKIPSFDFVVSAENNYYMAWQAMLCHYTCIKQMKQAPIIVVHGDDEPLLPPFQRIADHGGRVQRARSFRHDGGWEYPPRNTAGSLSVVNSDADYLIVCDPDMILLQPLPLDQYALPDNQITFDRVSYLYVADDNREWLEGPIRAAGFDPEAYTVDHFSGGVPHIIPRKVQQQLSTDWLHCMTYFEPSDELRNEPGIQVNWLATMWALIFAANRQGIEIVMTDWSIANCPGTKRVEEFTNEQAFVIHYCFGDEEFDKRNYMDESGAEQRVWACNGSAGTVNELIVNEIHEAAAYFSVNTPSEPL